MVVQVSDRPEFARRETPSNVTSGLRTRRDPRRDSGSGRAAPSLLAESSLAGRYLEPRPAPPARLAEIVPALRGSAATARSGPSGHRSGRGGNTGRAKIARIVGPPGSEYLRSPDSGASVWRPPGRNSPLSRSVRILGIRRAE